MADSVISRFDIQLDAGDEPIFKGGEVITGKLQIELRRPICINAIKLQMKGRAVWVNDPMKKDDIEKVLFDNDFTLLERPPGKPEPGHFTWVANFTYSLPFECPLPKGCPTSYEGPYAFIRYFIRASLVHEEEDAKIYEYYVKKAFNIVSPSDGHLIIGESQGVSDTATFGKCCCKGKLSAEFSLPKTGYLPGEDIVGNLRIGNKHPKGILSQVEVRLVDRVKRIGAPEIADTSPWRTLYYRRLEEEDTPVKNKAPIEKNGIFLMTVPAVCPTTKGDFDAVANEIHTLSPAGRLLESPSTATLRFRKQPFLKIEYALQLSLGPFLILEIPIDIGEHSTRDKSINLEPFVCGPQPIEERDEAGKIAIGGPFTYTPVYPYKEHATARYVNESTAYVPSIPTILEETAIPNGSHVLTETRQTVEQSPDEHVIVTTTKTIVTHVDGHETKTMEETVVDKGGEVTRTVEQTVLSDEGIETHIVEVTKTDAAGNEETTMDMSERQISEDDIPTAIEEAHERAGEIFDKLDHPHENETQPLTTSSHEDGEDTTVTTEEFEHDGVKTLRTTTVTQHADGSESTMVQEHSVQEATE